MSKDIRILLLFSKYSFHIYQSLSHQADWTFINTVLWCSWMYCFCCSIFMVICKKYSVFTFYLFSLVIFSEGWGFLNFNFLVLERAEGKERERDLLSYLSTHLLVASCVWTHNLSLLGQQSNQLRYSARARLRLLSRVFKRTSVLVLSTYLACLIIHFLGKYYIWRIRQRCEMRLLFNVTFFVGNLTKRKGCKWAINNYSISHIPFLGI